MQYLVHSPFWPGNNYWWVANLVWLLVLGGLVALGVALALRLVSRLPTGGDSAGPRPPAFDPALNELRVRYARGEVSRDEYLRAASDLGAPIPPSESPSPPPPA